MQPPIQEKTELKTEQNQSTDASSFFRFLLSLNRGSTENTTLVIAFMGLVGFFGTSMMFVVTMAMPRINPSCPYSSQPSAVHPALQETNVVELD